MTNTLKPAELQRLFAMFESALKQANYESTSFDNFSHFRALMMLSASPTISGVLHIEDNEENRKRLLWAIHICKWLTLAPEHWFDQLPTKLPPTYRADQFPLLYVNGEAQQLFALIEFAKLYYPAERIRAINCGNRGIGNTLTQFQTIRDDGVLRDEIAGHELIGVVTSAYHVPRVKLTANMLLTDICKFEILPVPFLGEIAFPASFEKILGEMERIAKYASTGQIARP